MRKLIEAKYKLAQQGDYYGLLGTTSSASSDEIRKAYFKLAKNLHPDKVGRLGLTDIKAQSVKVFQLITEAYNTLNDAKKRKAFDDGTLEGGAGASAEAKSAAANAASEAAKIAYHKGSVMMQKRAYSEAEAYFREATEAHKDVARYWQALGWAIFNDETARAKGPRLEATKKAYEAALELDPHDAQTHYSLGLFWKAKSDAKKMRRSMEKTLNFDPKHINAQRELRLLKMRSTKTESAAAAKNVGFIKGLWNELTRKR